MTDTNDRKEEFEQLTDEFVAMRKVFRQRGDVPTVEELREEMLEFLMAKNVAMDIREVNGFFRLLQCKQVVRMPAGESVAAA